MNETYLLIMGVLFLYSLIQIMTGAFEYDANEFRSISTFIMCITTGILFILSPIVAFGDDIIETKPATNTRVGNELVIQAEGWPTQVINDISLIDKEVQINKITNHNAWGGDIVTTYTVEPVIKTEVE